MNSSESGLPLTPHAPPAGPQGSLNGQPSPFWKGLKSTLQYPRAILGHYRLPELNFDTASRRESGKVIVLPGIEGLSTLSHSFVNGLIDGGVSTAIEIFDWTYRVKPAVFNLWMSKRHVRLAAAIAEMICDYQDQHPDRPVTLIGHSGGGALIVKILESLPPKRTITNGILIAPALSPRYNLADALSRVSDQLYHFRSPFDLYFLGFGTITMGTLDRKFTVSAGNRGFQLPSESGEIERKRYAEKLTQIHYDFRMIRDWHYGGHLSCMNRVFVERHIAPLIPAHRDTEIAK